MHNFTDEQINLCKSCDLVDLAEDMGYTPISSGSTYYLEEMDSLNIFDRISWTRFSNNTGGDQIAFVQTFGNMDFHEAIIYILSFMGYDLTDMDCDQGMKEKIQNMKTKHIVGKTYKPIHEKNMKLPAANNNNRQVIDYLCNKRCLSKKVVNFFISRGLLYEDIYHHCVFKGYDKHGKVQFASRRGSDDKLGSTVYKKDVYDNNKSYGINIVNDHSTELVVFEAAIDMMSYMDIYNNYTSNKLALGGVSKDPLDTFLDEHPQIDRLRFCLDNDEAGRKAAKELTTYYEGLGYMCAYCPVTELGCKDYNEWLKKLKTSKKDA